MNSCPQFEEDILLAADGSLPERDLAALEQHAGTCTSCAQALRAARLVETHLAQIELAPLSSSEIDAHIGAIGARIRAANAQPHAPISKRLSGSISARRIAIAAAVLALIGAAIAFIVSRGDAPPAPTIVDVRDESTEHISPPAVVDAQASDPEPEVDTSEPSPTLEQYPADPRRYAEFAAATELAAEAQRDAERLALARRSVATALADAAFTPIPDPVAFAADVDARVGELVRGDWPLVRIVEGYARDTDPDLARRALRYLAARGDVLSLAAVRAATRKPELASEAWRALAHVQPERVDLLDRDPAARVAVELTLQSLVERGGREAAEALEDALRRSDPSRSDPSRSDPVSLADDGARENELLDTLVGLGIPAIPSLLRLAEQGRPSRPLALDALARTPGAAAHLAALVRDTRPPIGDETLLSAFARIPPEGPRADGVFAWIAARAGESRTRSQALTTLASCGSPAALGVLVDLSARDSAVDVDDAIVTLVELRPESATELAASNDARGRKRDQQTLLGMLSTIGRSSAVPGLIALSESPLCDLGDRRLALLACGVEGSDEDAQELERVFDRTSERELRAAVLVALHTVRGSECVARVLADVPDQTREAILAILDSTDLAQRGVHAQARVAREITRQMARIRP